jgi:hypothetical protein
MFFLLEFAYEEPKWTLLRWNWPCCAKLCRSLPNCHKRSPKTDRSNVQRCSCFHYAVKVSESCIRNWIRQSWDATLKVIPIHHVEKVKNWKAVGEFMASERSVQSWREATKLKPDKDEIHPKIFQWSQTWSFIGNIIKDCWICAS